MSFLMTKNNAKATLFASLIAAMILTFSSMGMAQAEVEIIEGETDAEKQDRLGHLMRSLEREIESLEKEEYSVERDTTLSEKEKLLSEVEEGYYALSPKKELADISDERREYLTSLMWKLASTGSPFLSMGIDSYTGEINIRLDESKTDNIDKELQALVGDDVVLDIVYGSDDARFQGSCPDQTGECDTIIGASKGENGNTGLDCTINIVATKGSGQNEIDGVVIPHHCNTGHHDYYQKDKSDSDQKVGSHHTDGGWFCDCDFVEIDSRASSTGKVNDDGTDISVTYGDLSDNDAVYLIGQYSGSDDGTIVEVNQWVWIGGSLYTDLYFVKNISFNSGDSGAPIVRSSDDKYGGMNIGAGTETVDGNSITVNYVHDWTFLKSKLGLN